jgi:hypothetical protein
MNIRDICTREVVTAGNHATLQPAAALPAGIRVPAFSFV